MILTMKVFDPCNLSVSGAAVRHGSVRCEDQASLRSGLISPVFSLVEVALLAAPLPVSSFLASKNEFFCCFGQFFL